MIEQEPGNFLFELNIFISAIFLFSVIQYVYIAVMCLWRTLDNQWWFYSLPWKRNNVSLYKLKSR